MKYVGILEYIRILNLIIRSNSLKICMEENQINNYINHRTIILFIIFIINRMHYERIKILK